MKKYVFLLCIVLMSFASEACEICGCGLGNYYIGLLPQFSRSFMGVRYQFSRFHTVMKNDATQYSKDLFQTVEVLGGINLGKRWQVLALVPINFVHQVSDDGSFDSKGLGDVLLMGNYKVFDQSSCKAKQRITQSLWVGAGLKLATGKFQVDVADPALIALANTQGGTGSTDFMLNAMHNINFSRLGISTSARYKINTANKDAYFLGNRFSTNSLVCYTVAKGKSVITPNAGLLYDYSAANQLAHQKIADTGGYLLSAATGVELSINAITIGGNLQFPLTQNFANAQTNTQLKGMLHLTFSL